MSSFVPYELGIDEKRYNFLRFDLHPILTHFGVGLAVLLVLDALAMLVFGTPFLGINLGYGGVLDFLALLLPFFVGFTALLGYYDGKYRYKKVSTKFLKRKLWLAIAYFAVSICIPVFDFTSGKGSIQALVILEGIFIVAAVVLALLLGLIGRELTCNAVPRGHEIAKAQEAEQPQESE